MLRTRITTVTEHQKLFKVYLQIYTLLDRPKILHMSLMHELIDCDWVHWSRGRVRRSSGFISDRWSGTWDTRRQQQQPVGMRSWGGVKKPRCRVGLSKESRSDQHSAVTRHCRNTAPRMTSDRLLRRLARGSTSPLQTHHTFLPTALAGKVLQSVVSVSPFVCFRGGEACGVARQPAVGCEIKQPTTGAPR